MRPFCCSGARLKLSHYFTLTAVVLGHIKTSERGILFAVERLRGIAQAETHADRLRGCRRAERMSADEKRIGAGMKKVKQIDRLKRIW